MKRKYIFSPAILGILFMILSQFSFSLNDSLVKLIVIESSNQLSLLNTIFIRGLFTTLVILLYIKIVERKNLITIVSQIPYHKRGLYEVLTAICFLSGLILLPFAEVYTLLMTNPLFVTIFAFLFLKEKVGVRRWIAITVGFIGVLIVINPNKVDFNFLYILPIMAAIFLTIRDIKTKNIANDNNSFEIIFITSLLMTVFSGFGSLFSEFSLEFKSLFTEMNSYLSTHDWLAGDSYSLADISFVVYLHRLDSFMMRPLLKNMKYLDDWYDRIKSRPAYKRAIYDWGDKTAGQRAENGEKAYSKILEYWNKV